LDRQDARNGDKGVIRRRKGSLFAAVSMCKRESIMDNSLVPILSQEQN
jgi:hypothetical protein